MIQVAMVQAVDKSR